MKAVVVHEFGGPEVMQYEDVPDPRCGVGEVVVRVHGAGVNFADHLMRRGAYRGQKPPLTPGLELAGEVVMVGPNVESLEVGQRVMGWAHDTYAELVAVPASRLVSVPERLSLVDAAAVPVVFGTAWQALASLANVQPGERVLIHAAGSGVGSAAIQVAHALGAWVLATAGEDWKLERARELGADAVINYRLVGDGAADPANALSDEIAHQTGGEGVQVALEGVGRATFGASLKALAPLGRMVIYGSPSGSRVELDTLQAIFKNLTLYGLAISAEPRSQITADDFRSGCLPLLEQGRLKPIVDRVLPMEEAAEAHRVILDRRQFGKIVLTPGSSEQTIPGS